MSFGISPDVPTQEGDVQPTPTSYPTLVAGKAALAASVSPQLVDSFDSGVFRATEYLITISQGGNFQVSKAILLCDGPNSYLEHYGRMSSTGALLATLTSTVTGGAVANLAVTLVSAVAATVNFQALRVLA